MMANGRGSVRIGPVSLFTLIIVLCLAVMAVLSVTTARATYAFTQRQAEFTTDVYANETAAQNLVALVDAELSAARGAGGGQAEALAAIGASLDDMAANAVAAVDPGANAGAAGTAAGGAGVAAGMAVDASVEGTAVHAQFVTEAGRCLDVVIDVTEDAHYQIAEWKTTTLWDEEGANETLWSGSAQG